MRETVRSDRSTSRRWWLGAATLASAFALIFATTMPTQAEPEARRAIEKTPVAYGYGGAVSSVDADATAAGLSVLRQGGTAVDAAVATAAALGVTEPYSAGIGGGGYFVYYDARSGRVHTLDGRETAPQSMPRNAFINPATGAPYPFTPDLVTSGVSVGVPGTPATWERALRRWGRLSLRQNLRPAIRIAEDGFEVDATFNLQTTENAARFAAITSTSELFLPGGSAPEVGSTFRNRDLADTYRLMASEGVDVLYDGPIAREIVRTVKAPPKTPGTALPVPPGYMKRSDLRNYEVIDRRPTRVSYRGLDVYSMAPSSSGGTTVGEALNIVENFRLRRLPEPRALHYYLDASALAFADRNAYVGDPAYVDVPTETLLSQRFANSRACLIPENGALTPIPTAPGSIPVVSGCRAGGAAGAAVPSGSGSTTHLVTSDRWGNVVSYTLTIEQTGGSGIVVPDRGFILNNELTDFSTEYRESDPNRIQGGKRPRSSMSPTIVLRDGRPWLALGSPGGATIITTVLQTLLNRVDLGYTLPQAVEAPRASHRNLARPATTTDPRPYVPAEQAFIDEFGAELDSYNLTAAGRPGTSAAEIGAVAALELDRGGRVLAVAERERRGGGSAGVVWPIRR